MIKVKDGYAKLISTSYTGNANYLLKSNGDVWEVHTGRNNEKNKIVRTDVSGYLQTGWINTTSGNTTATISRIYCSNDLYIRYQTPAQFFSALANDTDNNKIYLTIAGQKRELAVNADTLDGLHADSFASSTHTHYIGTTQVLSSSANLSLTGIIDLTLSGFINGAKFNTNTNNAPIKICRLNRDNTEYLAIGVDDSQALFDHVQDETVSDYYFKGTWTDTESGGGASKGSSYIKFAMGNTGTNIIINGNTALHSGNSSVSGGGSTWGSALTVKINGTSKTLTIPAKPSYSWSDITSKPDTFAPAAHTHTWASITDKIVGNNEFNFVNAGYSDAVYINYLPVDDRSKTATVARYEFRNGSGGTCAPLKALTYYNSSGTEVSYSNHTHNYYIGTTKVLTSSAALAVTGITTLTASGTIKSTYAGPAFHANPTSGWAYIRLLSGTGTFWDIATHSNRSYALEFRCNGNNPTTNSGMLLTTDGKLGIGTSSPTYNLHVVGTAYASTNVTSPYFKSTVATGTAPLTVASTTLVSNLNADMLDNKHLTDIAANGYIMEKLVIDATALDVNTYYPVIIKLNDHDTTRIECRVSLENQKPSWATHTRGFSTRKIWEVNGSGWGCSAVNRRILVSTYGFTDIDPVRGIGQASEASAEYVFVRGGGKYFFYVSHNKTATLYSEGYTYTITGGTSTISPTTTAPAAIVAPSLTFNAGTFATKTFSNTSGTVTVNIPTKTSHLTNDSGYLANSVPWSKITGAPTTLKNPKALTLFGVSYDGSEAKTVDKTTFIGTLSEGTSNFTDDVMLVTSVAGNTNNNGFDTEGYVNIPYKRKAIYLWNYIKTKTDPLYVTKLGTSGNYLTYTINGTASNITVPYATTSGNAATATKLKTARKINGTDFDGSAAITTALWGTTRNITIGNTKKSVDGSADISWSLSEIGAASSGHNHDGTYLKLTGGTMTGVITSTYTSNTWVNSLTSSAITLNNSGYGGWICGPTKNGRIAISTYATGGDYLYFGYGEKNRTTNSFATLMTWYGPENILTIDDLHFGKTNEIYTSLYALCLNYTGRGDQNVLICSGNGNVGIGNTAPSYKLHVTGTLGVTGTSTFGNTMFLPSAGLSYISSGSDKAGSDYTSANIVIRSWWGISFASFDNVIRTYLDTRTGNIGTKGSITAVGFKHSSYLNGQYLLTADGGVISRYNLLLNSWYKLSRPAQGLVWYKLSTIVSTVSDNTNNDWMIEIYAYSDLNFPSFTHGYLRCSSYNTGSTSIVLSTDPSTGKGGNWYYGSTYAEVWLYATIDSSRNVWLGVLRYYTAEAFIRVLQYSSVNAIVTSNWTTTTTAPATTYITLNGQMRNTGATAYPLFLNNVYSEWAFAPYGFSRSSLSGWGNQAGTFVTRWNDSTGGSIEFRRDNPSSGKLSLKVDGRVYVSEGKFPVLSSTYANNYWGIRGPDGGDVWIRTTSQGFIPVSAGSAGRGHSSLGTSSWYFATAYIDKVYGTLIGNASSALMLSATSVNAGDFRFYYYAGQPSIGSSDGMAYKGSSGSYKVWSYPESGTYASSTNANICVIRMMFNSQYWHEIFSSPNYNSLWHRSVINGSAGTWERFAMTSDIPSLSTLVKKSDFHIIWAGKMTRTSHQSVTWSATKLGGEATLSVTTSNTDGRLTLSVSGGTPYLAFCATSTLFVANSTAATSIYSAVSSTQTVGRSPGMGDYMVVISGSTIYIRQFRLANGNNDSWSTDGLSRTYNKDYNRYVKEFNLMIIGTSS